jgi:hypothetical protein
MMTKFAAVVLFTPMALFSGAVIGALGATRSNSINVFDVLMTGQVVGSVRYTSRRNSVLNGR